jgi:ribonucleoside-diphosphate reductase alpha chain
MTTVADDIKITDPNLITTIKPGTLRVIKRSGSVAAFDSSRIETAMKKAFLAVENAPTASQRIQDAAKLLTQEIERTLINRWPDGTTLHIESIQDLVELALMRAGEQKVARSYVLYREKRRLDREQDAQPVVSAEDSIGIDVTYPDGSVAALSRKVLEQRLASACKGLEGVDSSAILNDAIRNLYSGIKLEDVYASLVMCARTAVETDPNYSFVTARLLLNNIYEEGLGYLGVEYNWQEANISHYYPAAFKAFITRGIENEIINPTMAEFDLDRLASELDSTRDLQFTYLSIQTLYDRYFIHDKSTRYELPQTFFMRVAMGLAIAEPGNREDKAIEFYKLLSSFDFMSSTPTLFNSGTCHSQLSSCFLTTVPDDLDGIYGAIKDNALLSKFAGGLGNDWTPVRGMGARIKGTNGKSLGVVPFMNVADATAVAVNQGGKRKGAVCGYLETWHLDIEEFLELRKNTGDDRRRTHDMNTANWVPDLFMQRVFESADWTLFTPNETPDLHDLYGDEFTTAYTAYEKQAQEGKLLSKTIPAKTLWRKMLGMLFETGHPWVTFKDPCNLRSPQQHVGVVHSSNLCTEITLNTSAKEIAVCNLGSINLAQHVGADGIDNAKLEKTIKTAVRMLDNVIDINFYSVPQAENSNLQHRPVGMGIMGFQDALYKMRVSYASERAVELADEWMEAISYHAIAASAELAQERGSYKTFAGSLWSQGILPIDSIEKLAKTRGKYLEQDRTQRLDWQRLRKLAKKGMRNSNLMAIAPTATISNICGVAQSIEPTYQNLFVKSNMSGEFTVINPYLAADLKQRNLWDAAMVHDLKYYDGSVQSIDRIPADLKELYVTAFEVESHWLIDAASRRQKWIDQAQSLNLYMAEPSGKKLDTLYKSAWLRGLKTTYYLRSMGATNTEKSTIRDSSLNAVPQAPKACSIDDPDCEACQ